MTVTEQVEQVAAIFEQMAENLERAGVDRAVVAAALRQSAKKEKNHKPA
jgi:hypothetical protein